MAFEFECGDGWELIIRKLAEKLEPMGVVATQVKEKFGTLRFYTSGGSDAAYEAIDDATDESARTCEVCGDYGELRGRGWMQTLCDDCHERWIG
jgi:hypothetical protein